MEQTHSKSPLYILSLYVCILLPYEVWSKLSAKNAKIITSIHPLEDNLTINIHGDEVIATPYRKSNHVEAVVEQNNLTNLSLKTVENN